MTKGQARVALLLLAIIAADAVWNTGSVIHHRMTYPDSTEYWESYIDQIRGN